MLTASGAAEVIANGVKHILDPNPNAGLAFLHVTVIDPVCATDASRISSLLRSAFTSSCS